MIQQPKKQFVLHGCQFCENSGWVSAVHRENKNQYAFLCGSCGVAASRGLSASIPTWSSYRKDRFELYKDYLTREGWKKDVV